ncbi:MAG: hypothetical protein R3B96_01610 [Pirellulaceae bacterium]
MSDLQGDGLSNTYMVGERQLWPQSYTNGNNYLSDDHSLFVGDDFDVHAWTDQPPMRDADNGALWRFGSCSPECLSSRVGRRFGADHQVRYQSDHSHESRQPSRRSAARAVLDDQFDKPREMRSGRSFKGRPVLWCRVKCR